MVVPALFLTGRVAVVFATTPAVALSRPVREVAKVVVPVAVRVENLPVLAAVPPIAGGDDKSKEPPSVKLPVVVTVPNSEIPETVPVPLTLVTDPEPLLLNVVQSVELR